MDTALKEGLKDKPELLLQAIESEDNILHYFKEVLRYNNIKEIPPDTAVFYLSFEYAKAQVESAIKENEELKKEILNNNNQKE